MILLKREYLADVNFVSETDTEVIVQMIELFVQDGMEVIRSFP